MPTSDKEFEPESAVSRIRLRTVLKQICGAETLFKMYTKVIDNHMREVDQTLLDHKDLDFYHR
jgi:hypothetical protein